jgi:HEAT repeat protein
MPVTLQQILKQLDTDEPNYTALAALGPEAIPQLAILVKGEDPGLASKAAYLASLIQSDDSLGVLSSAAESSHETVRVAAAAGLRNLAAPKAAPLADKLLEDADPGVRKLALQAVGRVGIEVLEPKLKTVASKDSVPALRQLATEQLRRISESRSEAKKETEAVRKPVKRSTRSRSKGKK